MKIGVQSRMAMLSMQTLEIRVSQLGSHKVRISRMTKKARILLKKRLKKSEKVRKTRKKFNKPEKF